MGKITESISWRWQSGTISFPLSRSPMSLLKRASILQMVCTLLFLRAITVDIQYKTWIYRYNNHIICGRQNAFGVEIIHKWVFENWAITLICIRLYEAGPDYKFTQSIYLCFGNELDKRDRYLNLWQYVVYYWTIDIL